MAVIKIPVIFSRGAEGFVVVTGTAERQLRSEQLLLRVLALTFVIFQRGLQDKMEFRFWAFRASFLNLMFLYKEVLSR